MTAREYFDANVNYAVEIEYCDGSREWLTYHGEDALREALGFFTACNDCAISDVDYGSQEDKFCDRVINLAILNWTKNRDWWQKNKLKSLDDVIVFILDNELYKA